MNEAPVLTPAERVETARAIEEYEAIATAASSRSFLDYLSLVVIDSRPAPRRFGLLAEPWQWAMARTYAPAIESVAGLRSDYGGPRNFWFTLPRGSDKTSSTGRFINWLLAFAKQPNLRIQVAAADKDQSAQLLDFANTEASHNPWLASRLKFSRNQILSKVNGGVLTALAADASGSYGAKVDMLVCDELVWWQKRDLFDTLYSGMAKRPGSSTMIITNAGLKRTWQDEVRQMALGNPRSWIVYESPGNLASWMSEEKIAELAQGLPKIVADRVLRNLWKDPSEESGYVTRSEAESCATLGSQLGLKRAHRADPRYTYVGSIDVGLTNDRTALCIAHMDGDGRVIVDKMDVWQGSKGAPVHLDDVALWLDTQQAAFSPSWVLDPYQLEFLIQKYPHLDISRFQYRGGQGNHRAAANLLTLIRSGRLAWHPGCGDVVLPNGRTHTLVDELAELIVKPMPYGFRMDHEAMKGAHDDRVTAVAMAALKLTEIGPQANLASVDERFF